MPLSVMSSLRSTAIVPEADPRTSKVTVPFTVDLVSIATVCPLACDCELPAASMSRNARVMVRPFTVTVGHSKNPVDASKAHFAGAGEGIADWTAPASGDAKLAAAPNPDADISLNSDATSGVVGDFGLVASEHAAKIAAEPTSMSQDRASSAISDTC